MFLVTIMIMLKRFGFYLLLLLLEYLAQGVVMLSWYSGSCLLDELGKDEAIPVRDSLAGKADERYPPAGAGRKESWYYHITWMVYYVSQLRTAGFKSVC